MKLKRVKSWNSPADEYYEVHYMLDEGNDVEIIDTYRGKAMRKYETAVKCMEAAKKKYPSAVMWDIALYDNSGRID